MSERPIYSSPGIVAERAYNRGYEVGKTEAAAEIERLREALRKIVGLCDLAEPSQLIEKAARTALGEAR